MEHPLFLQRCIRRPSAMAGTFAAHRGRPRSLRALGFFVLGMTFAISLSGSPDAFAAEPDPGKDIASISAGFGFPYVETHLDDDPVIPAYADIYSYEVATPQNMPLCSNCEAVFLIVIIANIFLYSTI